MVGPFWGSGVGFHRSPFGSRVERVTQAVTQQVECKHGQQERCAGKDHVPPLRVEVLGMRRRSSSPSSPSAVTRRRPGTTEPPRARSSAGAADLSRRRSGQRGSGGSRAVTMRRFEAPSERAATTNSRSRSDSTCPRTTRAIDVQLTSATTRITVRTPGRDGAVHAAVAERAGGGDPDAQQQHGERQHDVDEARQQRVDPAAVVAGQQPDGDADQHGDAGADDPDEQRDARAVDGAREDVAPERVDAEAVLGGRARAACRTCRSASRSCTFGPGRAGELHHAAGRAPPTSDQRDDHGERRQRDAVGAQAAPEQLPRRARDAGREVALVALLLREQAWRADAHRRSSYGPACVPHRRHFIRLRPTPWVTEFACATPTPVCDGRSSASP